MNLHSSKGFTLIEVLVTIVLLGILSAIAVPSFLSQISKGREVDAKQQMSSFLKKQQIYYNEKSEFAVGDNWIGKLGMHSIKKSANYDYSLLDISSSPEFIDVSVGVATPRRKNIRAYLGAAIVKINAENEPEFLTIICRAKRPELKAITAADLDFTEGLRCAGNTQTIK